jgi:hypothetical protein
MTASPILSETFVVVQIARTLPSTDAGWITVPRLNFVGGSQGLGNVIGDAYIEQVFGVRTDPASRSFFDLGQAPDFGRQGPQGSINDTLAGAVIRLIKNVSGGSITIGTKQFTAFWWGIVRGPISQPDSQSTRQVSGSAGWRCAGIESVLDQISLHYGYVKPPTGSTAVRLGYLPPFNAASYGDRSSSSLTVNGQSVYVHNLNVNSDAQWTAIHILRYLLAVHARPTLPPDAGPAGWNWTVSDPDGCLNYETERLDLDGLTLFQAVNALASQNRGCAWYVTVTNETATINVVSTSRVAVSFGGFSMPASSFTSGLDIRGNAYITGVSIDEDWDSVYNAITVRGARPWRAITVSLSSFDQYWDVGDETEWNNDPFTSLTDDVWRRWKLKNDWNGQQYNSTSEGLRNYLATDNYGYTGDRSYNSGQTKPPAWSLEFTRMLPCSPAFGTAEAGARQAPVVVVGTTGDWTDKSQVWQLTLESSEVGPPSIRLDDGRQGQDIEAELDAGSEILITLGVREADPLIVSWSASPDQRPNATPRHKMQPMPQAEEWTICPGCVRGVDVDDELDVTSVELSARDDRPKMEAALALLIAGLSVPNIAASWTSNGELDIGTTGRPGRLLTQIIKGDGTVYPASVITRRTWTRNVVQGEGDNAGEVAYWSTSYSTQRLPPTLQALI